MPEKRIRSFIAIELSEAMKREVEHFVEAIRNKCAGFRFLPSHNWHLTLDFLGQVEPAQIEELKRQIPKAVSDRKAFSISLEGLGSFSHAASPQCCSAAKGDRASVLWLGVGGDTTQLVELKKRLDHVLGKLHLPVESRAYHPHVTIARRAGHLSGRYSEPTQNFKGEVVDPIREVTLFKSELLAGGAKHIPLGTFSFGSSAF